jgi:hypothetical protein
MAASAAGGLFTTKASHLWGMLASIVALRNACNGPGVVQQKWRSLQLGCELPRTEFSAQPGILHETCNNQDVTSSLST